MAVPVERMQPLKLPPGPAPLTTDQRYWRSFKSQQLVPTPHSSPVTHISFPSAPSNPLALTTASTDTFAVTSGARIQIFSSRTRRLLRAITRFGPDDHAYSGSIRRDGRVLIAGSESGAIQAFDINSRAILKTWREHKQPVWVTKWCPQGDLTAAMSCSDDRTVRLWDLPSEESQWTGVGHGDYVRCGEFMPGQGSGNLLVSGSYDQTVRLWDSRAGAKAAMIFQHASTVESVLPMPGGTTLLAAVDNQINVLDLVAAKPLERLQNHQKTVTSLCLASNGTRVLSGALDGHVKVFETMNWSVVAGLKYSSPVLSLCVVGAGVSREDRHLAVGLHSGVMSIRTRLSGQQKVQAREKEKEIKALIEGTTEQLDRKKSKRRKKQERILRGKDFTGEGVDIVIDGNSRGKVKKGTPWEKALREGRYASALDLVINAQPHSKQNTLTLITALRHRSALRTALKGRNEEELEPILKWLNKIVKDPRHIKLTSDVGFLILDLYAQHLGEAPMIDKLVKKLHTAVRSSAEYSQQAHSTLGMLDLLTAGT
ncbi:WD repeat-containing protein 57 [Viridothelium virens]|uniref:WD repeat-containing protein 57 n=1 Tax=Viridothelium virens TaxID=1048519 RepID=A0A6A6HJJ2_VIRVR|nr:WD repeat-containing protein 57 [Viridothelium virens]